jgi:hypothetical protein
MLNNFYHTISCAVYEIVRKYGTARQAMRFVLDE